MDRSRAWWAAAVILAAGRSARAGDMPAPAGGVPCVVETVEDGGCPRESREPFTAGSWSLQLMTGDYVKTQWGPDGPAFTYIDVVGRVGYTPFDPILNDT